MHLFDMLMSEEVKSAIKSVELLNLSMFKDWVHNE